MESYILNDFEVKPKHSSEEALQKWRKLCGFVKNPKRRFRFTANLSKRYEAQAMRRTNQVPPLSLILFIIYLFHSTQKKKKHPQCPIKSLEHSHQLSHKKCHFDTPKTYFIILAHHFTISHLPDVLFFNPIH